MGSNVKGIVINRMFVGKYLSSNLGHEIINLFLADNGNSYLYLNATGNYSTVHDGIGAMLMVKYFSSDTFEVVAMARGLHPAPGANKQLKKEKEIKIEHICAEQVGYIGNQPGGDVAYGGVSILDIFGDAGQQNIFITYRADEVFMPVDGKRIFLQYGNDARNYKTDSEIRIAIRKHNLPKTSLKSYIEDRGPDSDLVNLEKNLIDDPSLWDSSKITNVSITNKITASADTLFDICGIQNDENCFSNALAYFMKRPEYKTLWTAFFKEMGIDLADHFTVEREVDISEKGNGLSGRIDLLLRDKHHIIIIENKIKSDINVIGADTHRNTNQLYRYEEYVNSILAEARHGRFGSDRLKGVFIILSPQYNRPHLSGNQNKTWLTVSYKKLFRFLCTSPFSKVVDSDFNFSAFRHAMQRHTLDTANDYLREEMLQKFLSRINEINKHKK